MALTASQQAELDSLQAALLKLRTGQMPSRVVFLGHETDFARVDLGDLKTRVSELESMAASPTGRARTALRFNL
jgi:hypothetical protein